MTFDSSLTTIPDASAYLVGIGSRVKSLRAKRGMSRRLLAQSSAVSERYLAELESGKGNISILRLRQVATAMSVPVEDLVSESTSASTEFAYLLQYIRQAEHAELAQLYRKLSGRQTTSPITIALIGLRGAGKSTIGQALAQRLKYSFTDLVRTIEQRAGMGVSEIFSLGGQSAYRRFEMECLEQTIERTEPGIIEVGGSLVSEPLAYERLLSSCITIWLRASPEDHMNRVIAQGDIRPMANNNHAMEDLQRILSEREILYKRANYVIDTSGDRVSDTVNECLKLPAVNEILRTVGKVQT